MESFEHGVKSVIDGLGQANEVSVLIQMIGAIIMKGQGLEGLFLEAFHYQQGARPLQKLGSSGENEVFRFFNVYFHEIGRVRTFRYYGIERCCFHLDGFREIVGFCDGGIVGGFVEVSELPCGTATLIHEKSDFSDGVGYGSWIQLRVRKLISANSFVDQALVRWIRFEEASGEGIVVRQQDPGVVPKVGADVPENLREKDLVELG